MKSTTLLLALLLTAGCPVFSSAQDFSGFDDFLRKYEIANAESQAILARSFIDWQQAQGGFPIRESDGKVVFVYIGNGNERDVRLTGDFRQSSPFNVYWDSIGEPMTRVGAVLYCRHTFEVDARLDYKFIVDGRDQRDPLNPRTLVSGSGGGIEVSELVMLGHQSPLMTSGPVRGSLHRIEESWAKPAVTINGPIYYFEPYFSRRKRPDPRLRLWISAGTYEGAIYDDVHTMEAYFRSVNVPIKTVLFHQGHSFGAWRESAIQMLVHFFPTQP